PSTPRCRCGGCERHSDGRLKKRTGFGPHPGRRKPKPDAAGMQVAHVDFSLQTRGMRAAFRRAIEKADRFWSAPWRAKTQARCGWDAVRARQFLAGVAGGCERHSDGRLKKRTGFGPHPGGRKTTPDAAGM